MAAAKVKRQAHHLRRVSLLACFFLVLLRFSIGWQFLYEGAWKWQSQLTGKPWSAEGYLKNAQGPFRDFYLDLVDDPYDLEKLDYDKVAATWDSWHKRFLEQHEDLKEDDKRTIDTLLNGPQSRQWLEPLKILPDGIDLSSASKYVSFDEERKRLVATEHLVPQERNRLLKLVTTVKEPADQQRRANDIARRYQAAVKKLFDRTSRLSLKEQLAVLLKLDPERAGVVDDREIVKGTLDEHRIGEIDQYRNAVDRYEKGLKRAASDFDYEHLNKQLSELQQMRVMLTGPVNALSSELITKSEKLLTPKQVARGRVPLEVTKINQINQITIWSLIVIGALLMLGLFTRLAALAAAGLLLAFYFAMPPLPGLPPAPGPEHSLIVNKNLIEAIACLALVWLPSGRWIGLDQFVRRVIFRRKN